jgi:prepilin peptidase CpaA
MTVVLALLGLALQVLHGSVLSGILASLIVFVSAAICWRRGWLGGGDVKLLGAAALAIPPGQVAHFVASVALIGAGLALAYLLASRVTPAPGVRRPGGLVARAIRIECWRIRRGGPLPYACAIAAGFLFISI